MKQIASVSDWPEAFDACRERNRPLVVQDSDGSIERIYPSGVSKELPSGAYGSIDLIILPED